jgi:hypothetical protein
MKKLILTAVTTVAIVAGAWRVGRAQAQPAANHPDFSGKWAVDVQASSPGLVPDGVVEMRTSPLTPRSTPGGPASFGSAFTARQDSSALAVESKFGVGQPDMTVVYKDMTVVYKLDGSDSMNLEGTSNTVSTATWRNGTLTILTRLTEINGMDVGVHLARGTRAERVMSLDANGRLLINTTVGVDPTYLTVYRRAN